MNVRIRVATFRFIIIPLILCLSANIAAEVSISKVDPSPVMLESGKAISIRLQGAEMKKIRGVMLSKDEQGRQRVNGLRGRYIGSDTNGRIAINLSPGITAGKYFIQLTDGRNVLIPLPAPVSVVSNSSAANSASTNSRQVKPGSSASSASKPHNLPPQVISVKTPAVIEAQKSFTVQVDTNDDTAVTALLVKFNNRVTRMNARRPHKKQTQFQVRFTPPTAGAFEMEVTALDAKQLKSTVKKVAINVAGASNSRSTPKAQTSTNVSKAPVTAPGSSSLLVDKEPPVIKNVLIVGSISPGKDFRVQASAEDNMSVKKFEVTFLGKTSVVSAHGKKRETVRNNYKAPASGKHTIDVVAIDSSGLRSKPKQAMLDMDMIIEKREQAEKQRAAADAKRAEALEKSKQRAAELAAREQAATGGKPLSTRNSTTTKPNTGDAVIKSAAKTTRPISRNTRIPSATQEPTETLGGNSGASISRSCTQGSYSTTINLQSPSNNAYVDNGSEFVWTRSEHETCGTATIKRYLFLLHAQNRSQTTCNPSNCVYRYIEIDENYIGNGVTSMSAQDLAKLNQIGIQDGDTFTWSMRYRSEYFNQATDGAWQQRSLILGQAPATSDPGTGNGSAGNNTTGGSNPWPNKPRAVLPNPVYVIGGPRVCYDVELELAPNRDPNKTIGLFVHKGMTSNLGIDYGWVDPDRTSQGGVSDLAGSIEVLRGANGQFTKEGTGSVMSSLRFCMEERSSVVAGTRSVNFSIADRAVEAYTAQQYTDTRQLPIQVTAQASNPSANTGTPSGNESPDVTFNDILPAFQHAKCQNCHSVAADNFAVGGGADGVGLPSNHPGVNSTTNCMACHSSFLTNVNNVAEIDLDWQPAFANHVFAGKSAPQLCAMGKTGAGGHDAEEHLTEDRLILWAIYNGAWNGSGMTAVNAWKDTVHTWADAGMPCN
ncbi:hypothetical protein [Aurantivibrio plasticivorans]